MRPIKIILFVIIVCFLAISIFSIVLSYKVLTNFYSLDVYNLSSFNKDIELSITVTVANIIGDVSLFYFLWKKGILQKILNINGNKKSKNI